MSINMLGNPASCIHSVVAKWLMRSFHKREGIGSNPINGTCGNGEMVSQEVHILSIARFEYESRY